MTKQVEVFTDCTKLDRSRGIVRAQDLKKEADQALNLLRRVERKIAYREDAIYFLRASIEPSDLKKRRRYEAQLGQLAKELKAAMEALAALRAESKAIP